MEIPMKLLLKKEEERREGEEEGVVEEEILKHVKERMVKETIKVEDPHPMDMEDTEEDLVVQKSWIGPT